MKKRDRFSAGEIPESALVLQKQMDQLNPNLSARRVWEPGVGGKGFMLRVLDNSDVEIGWVYIPHPDGWVHKPAVLLAFHEPNGRFILISGTVHEDGKPYIHLSISRKDRCPSYKDLAEVHELFIPNLEAVQMFVPKKRHINIHPYVLHLWAPFGHSPLPDFARGGDTI